MASVECQLGRRSPPPPSPPPPSPPPPSPPSLPPPLCAVDGAYTFTGAATSYLTATSRTGLVGGGLGFTLCAWVYRTRTDRAWDRLIDFYGSLWNDNIIVSFNNGPLIYEVLPGASLSATTPGSFPANVWTHVAVVQSRASLTDTYGPAQIYWNGASVATTSSMRFPLPVSRSNLYVGKSNWAGEATFTGQMKDLLVWDVALSPAQLDGVRLGGGLPSTPAPLVSMMRTWCGAAPPSPPSLPPSPPPSPPPLPPLCAVDGAYTFTGAATSYLTATSRTGLVGGGLGFTLCAWVYRTRTDRAWDRLIDFYGSLWNDNIIVSFNNGPLIYEVLPGASLSATTPGSFPANVWTHVAVVQSRASLTDTYGPAQIYWNGASVATTSSMRFPLPVSRSNLYVGKSNWAGEATFTGQMKDLLVWDVALSPAQLDGVRLGGGLPSTPAPLVSMMRTWCGAAPPPSPPPSLPPSPPPPSPPPSPPPPSPPPPSRPPPSPPPPSPPPPSPSPPRAVILLSFFYDFLC